jgi:hypothetical protein
MSKAKSKKRQSAQEDTQGSNKRQKTEESKSSLLSLLGLSFLPSLAFSRHLFCLGISPSVESVDYVNNKKQFQLHTLLTEQR